MTSLSTSFGDILHIFCVLMRTSKAEERFMDKENREPHSASICNNQKLYPIDIRRGQRKKKTVQVRLKTQ